MIQDMATLFPGSRHEKRQDVSSAHGLLEQGGFIRAVGSGVYTLLPLGWLVHKRITDLVYDRMATTGVQNIQMPLLHPVELWAKTGRLDHGLASKTIFTTEDPRAGKRYILSPTAEEVVTALVAAEIQSWRDLPLSLHQIATKFRAEIRPHSGLLRCREFVMSDAYSFDKDENGMHDSVAMFGAMYNELFRHVGVAPIIPVQANNGDIGGKGSTELMLACDVGEDTLLVCESCGFGSNVEAVEDPESVECPVCKTQSLMRRKGMELGHVFSLQTTYSDTMNAGYTDADGQKRRIWMGCYGLGTTRLMQAIAEVNRDNKGLMWPTTVAPYDVHVIATKPDDPCQVEVMSRLTTALDNAGLSALLDCRSVSTGVKFKDADLIGCPWRVTIGRDAATGAVEVSSRSGETPVIVKPDEVPSMIR